MRSRRLRRGLIVAALMLAGAASPARAATPLQPVQPGFQDEVVLDDLESPMAVRFAPPPDERIFVAEKSGVVQAYDGPGDRTPAPVIDLSTDVHDFWDRGLLGMALDPAFATNPYLYLLYTRDARIGGRSPTWGDTCEQPADAGCEASGRLVRVRIDELGVAGPVEPLIEDEWCQQFFSHTIGTVAFGPDGMLYAGAGDAAHYDEVDYGQLPDSGDAPPNPCRDPSRQGGMLRSQDVRTTGDPTGLDGAIVRVDPATGAPAPGNPFAGPDENARRIVAYGLRNPFRFTFRPGTKELWLGDVGWFDWEEVNRIRDATDAVAENFGWPCFEGDDPQPQTDPLELPLCTSLPASKATKPVFAYYHGSASFHRCDLRSGASLSGVAFAPGGYPEAYDGALFVGDFAAGCVFALPADAGGNPDPDAVELFARRPDGAGGPVELQAGPGGDLYYTLFDPVDPSRGSLHRIAYRPGNHVPVAEAAATPDDGPAPLDVAFSAAGSSDPDDDALSYAWDLDGDGGFDDATGVTASRTYGPGQVRVGVRVTDADGASDTAGVTVSADNTRPRPVIDAPAAGLKWVAGDEIAFHGSAADDQDGTIGATGLDWVITLDHCTESTGGCHAHPFEQRHGVPGGTFTAPVHPYPTRLVISLVATDSGGLESEASIRLEQRPPAGPSPSPSPSPTAAPSAGPVTRPAPTGERLGVRLTAPVKRVLARRIPLAARCSRPCVLRVRADLLARGRSTRLPSPALAALDGRTRVIVRIPAAARSRAREALRRRRAARLRVTATARDGTGATASARHTIRLVRGR